MHFSKKSVLVLSPLVLFTTTAFVAHAAPSGQRQVRRPNPDVQYFDHMVVPPGNLTSNWFYEEYSASKDQDRREQKRQQRRLAIREFSEKFVSVDCVPILTSTLAHLDNIRGFLHESFKTKSSFEFLEPILRPLVNVLDMDKNYTYLIKFVSKANNDDSSAQIKLSGNTKGLDDYDEILETAAWTEKNEPELLFKFRLRYLEKSLGVFQHVLKIAPEPVRQELKVSGFVQETRVLREHARSLLTCEGIPHVTIAGLEEELGEEESDSYVDRSAAREATFGFSHVYRFRITMAQIQSIQVPMDPAQAARCGFRNVTRNTSSKLSQPLEDEAVGPSSSSPQDKFVWSNEAMMRMAEAVSKGHRANPELAAMLF